MTPVKAIRVGVGLILKTLLGLQIKCLVIAPIIVLPDGGPLGLVLHRDAISQIGRMQKFQPLYVI